MNSLKRYLSLGWCFWQCRFFLRITQFPFSDILDGLNLPFHLELFQLLVLCLHLLELLLLLVDSEQGQNHPLHDFERAQDRHTEEKPEGAAKISDEQGRVIAPLFMHIL